jgi:tRNA (guanine-N7-)-methyltransferase
MTDTVDSTRRRPRINLTRTLPKPNPYAVALDTDCRDVAFNEERAPLNKGGWRSRIFHVPEDTPLDLEIGTGTGTHFANYAAMHPDRCLVGIELKYKPLIQTIRRALKGGARHVAVCRFHAFNLDQLFDVGEINDVFIHFPDPWTSPNKPKNRIVNRHTLAELFQRQRPGGLIEFKTDSREYFLWALEEIAATPYKIQYQSLNLHSEKSLYQQKNFVTDFEKIFVKQGVEINYISLLRP